MTRPADRAAQPIRPMLTQADIEREIMRMSDELEDNTYLFADLAEQAAIAEADYKHKYHTRLIRLASEHPKMAVNLRSATADLEAVEEYRHRLVSAARKEATKEALLSLRHRIDAMRTLAANVRAQT